MGKTARVWLSLWFGVSVALLALGVALPPPVHAAPAAQCPPTLFLTYVPRYGSFDDLWGGVDCVQPADYKVAVFIFVNGGWWTKPTFAESLTPIRPDGTWTTDITTGGQDQNATRIAAFLVPNGYTPPPVMGAADLPIVLYQSAAALVEVERGTAPVSITVPATRTRTATATPTVGALPSGTATPPAATASLTPSPTWTPAATPTPPATATASPTLAPSGTPSATATATAMATATLRTGSVTPTPTAGCAPSISFIYVPPIGSTQNLRGRVECVDTDANHVAVYILVNGGWWTKPSFAQPLTPIQNDGTWEADITTGGNDEQATQVLAFLVPNGCPVPLLSGSPALPVLTCSPPPAYVLVDRTTLPTPAATPTPLPTVTPTAPPTLAPPANDNFAAAAPLVVPASVAGDTAGATTETGEPRPCGGIGSTVWFRFQPDRAGYLTASTSGSDYDTVLAVYRGSSLTNLVLLACNDDWNWYTSQVSLSVDAGEQYYIQVGGFVGDTGAYTLSVFWETPPTPTVTPSPTLTPTPTPRPIPLYLPYLLRRTERPTPAVVFTDVPPYGSDQDLRGRVEGGPLANFRVAVYIYVNGWWTKPLLAQPLTPIAGDGTWTADITTGGEDRLATEIAAFLVPFDYEPPLLSGAPTLPPSLFAAAAAHALVAREPALRQVTFAGYTWQVKASTAPVGPGPNRFSDRYDDVWVDGRGRLHLWIAAHDGQWYSTEVVNTTPLGYGTYTFTLGTPVNSFDPQVVLGLFTYDPTAPQVGYRELDMEFSRWGETGPLNAQYVVQPWEEAGHRHRFTLTSDTRLSTHRFTWQGDHVTFESYTGRPSDPTADPDLHTWTYTGPDVPPAAFGTARINLWLFNGTPPADGLPVEVVVENFTFSPAQR